MELKGSKTEHNLKTAFEIEKGQAAKYAQYAKQAEAAGDDKTAKTLNELSGDQAAYADIWMQTLIGGTISDTVGMLSEGIADAGVKWEKMYQAFANDAQKEGFEDLAKQFEEIANKTHMSQDLLKEVVSGQVK